MIPSFTTIEPEKYLFDRDFIFDPLATTVYFPLNFDTEFTYPSMTVPMKDIFMRKNTKPLIITMQFRAINESVGVIFAHPDIERCARHEVSRDLMGWVTYIRSLGHETVLKVNTDKIVHPKIFHVYLYSHFAVADYWKIHQGEALKTALYYVNPPKGSKGRITMGRRLVTETIVHGNFKRPFIDYPYLSLFLDGNYYNVRVTVVDTGALQGTVSYATLARNTGVELLFKDTYTAEEKADMIAQYPNEARFDPYALGDLYLYECLEGHLKLIKTVGEKIGVTYSSVPSLTIGATVAELIELSLMKNCGVSDKKVLRTYTKTGNYEWLVSNKLSTSLFLAKVDGGRCRNNRPSDVCVKNPIADGDIVGCYGYGLRNQIYPIGRPYLFQYPIDSPINKRVSLRDFLDRYSKDFLPGLWCLRFSTPENYKLKSRQDFFASWKPPKDLSKLQKTDTDLAGVDWFTEDNVGMIRIFYRVIKYGLLNHDGLQWIMNVCGIKQRNELLDNTFVDCAMFYSASERVKSFNELVYSVNNHKGENTCEIIGGMTINVDNECHAWFGINMGDLLVDKLLISRDDYPKKTPMNEIFKLITNTVYGDMVSPFFEIGNTCAGNNITARARTMAWCMEKGLNGFETVTDGCGYELNRVAMLTGSSSLSAVEFMPMNSRGKCYSYAPLGNKPWSVIESVEKVVGGKPVRNLIVKWGEETYENEAAITLISRLSLEHLQAMFKGMDVLQSKTTKLSGEDSQIGQYSIEVKGVYSGGVFGGSANYAFFGSDGEMLTVKMRSYSKISGDSVLERESGIKRQEGGSIHPLMMEVINEGYKPAEEFFKGVWNNPKATKRLIPFVENHIIKPKEYVKSSETRFVDPVLIPGASFDRVRLLRECSLSQFTYDDFEQLEAWQRQAETLRDRNGQTYEALYTNTDGTLDYERMCKEINEAILAGEMLLQPNSVKYKSLKSHPNRTSLNLLKALQERRYGFPVTPKRENDNAESFEVGDSEG